MNKNRSRIIEIDLLIDVDRVDDVILRFQAMLNDQGLPRAAITVHPTRLDESCLESLVRVYSL